MGHLKAGRGAGRTAISKKIEFLVNSEGLTPKQAEGKAFGIARGGALGPGAKRAAGKRPPRSRT